MRSFAGSSGEHLLTPNITSSLFPQLPAGSRLPFLLGLCLIVAALLAATFFRLPAALITVSALGLPLLFLYYLQEADSHRDRPPRKRSPTERDGGCGRKSRPRFEILRQGHPTGGGTR